MVVTIGANKFWKIQSWCFNKVYKMTTGYESWIYAYEPKAKEQTVWFSRTRQIQWRLFVEEALWTKRSPVSSVKLVMWRIFHLSIVGRYTTVWSTEDLGEIRKTKERRGIIVHHDNASSHISSKHRLFDRPTRRIVGSFILEMSQSNWKVFRPLVPMYSSSQSIKF